MSADPARLLAGGWHNSVKERGVWEGAHTLSADGGVTDVDETASERKVAVSLHKADGV